MLLVRGTVPEIDHQLLIFSGRDGEILHQHINILFCDESSKTLLFKPQVTQAKADLIYTEEDKSL